MRILSLRHNDEKIENMQTNRIVIPVGISPDFCNTKGKHILYLTIIYIAGPNILNKLSKELNKGLKVYFLFFSDIYQRIYKYYIVLNHHKKKFTKYEKLLNLV